MGYEGGYPTVLKKLFLPYWRLLLHFFLQCIAKNKGGFDQLNKTQTSATVALVNGWDYNFSAFIFDNKKKMLDDPEKKIFMLYPTFIQMILDDRYPTLVKGPNFINLKQMGPGCFENACRNKRAKHHNFEGRFALEKHGRFANVVQGAPVAPAHPVGGDGNPPSISTTEFQETIVASQIEMEVETTADVTEESAPKKQRTDTAPDETLSGPSTAPESTPIIDPQPDPPTTDASNRTNLEDPDLYDFNFDFETTPSQTGSSSIGVRFEAGSSSGGGNTEHDEAAFRYATEKRQIFESESDSDEDEYIKRLKRRVVVLEQDAELKNAQIISLQQDANLKEAQISSLQSQLTNRDLTIDQLQGDVGMLMSTVYDLKAKLEKKFGNEFVDKEDEQFYVGRPEQTQEQRAAAHAAAEAERAVALEAYLAAKPKKQSSKSKKRREDKEKEKQSKK
ncbi:hypothetical protein Hdeb2414_s0009g00318541 [Helianthus debilis subsp. tardiflorus]